MKDPKDIRAYALVAMGLIRAFAPDSHTLFWVSAFWVAALTCNTVHCLIPDPTRTWCWVLNIGGACNAVAMIANGGKMPVVGNHHAVASWWCQATADSRLLFLCDINWMCSIGDMLLTAGVLGVLIPKAYTVIAKSVFPAATAGSGDSDGKDGGWVKALKAEGEIRGRMKSLDVSKG